MLTRAASGASIVSVDTGFEVFSRADLTALGCTRSEAQARLAAGRWRKIGKAVVTHNGELAREQRWRVGLIIDDKASKEQADKLTGVFAGQVGGPMANIAPLIGELLGIERLPIEYSDKGNRHSITIGDAVAIEVEDFAAQEGGETTKLTGVFHPSSSTLTIARPTASKIKAFGMEFKNAGKSAFSAPFNWAG